MNKIIIEKMEISHLNKISDILENEFDNFWNYNILKKELESENSHYFVALLNNVIVGFAGVSVVLDIAEITNIVVRKKYRGNEISSILLKEIIDFAESKKCSYINLEVNNTNKIAINLYKKFDFIQVGLRKHYYNGDDAILLQKTL